MNVSKELAQLRKMTMTELRDQYAQVWCEPSRSGNRDFLIKRIIWRMQALELGDLSERARRRAMEIANDADLRVRVPAGFGAVEVSTVRTSTDRIDRSPPSAGAMLTRKWRGRTIQVRVLPRGFEYEGEVHRSLSAVAKAATGSHWNGRLFFGLRPVNRLNGGQP